MALNTKYSWVGLVKVAIGLLFVLLAAQHFYALAQPNTLAAKLPASQINGLSLQTPGSMPLEGLLAEVGELTRAVFDHSEHCEVTELRLSWLENTILALNPFSNLFQQGVLVRERFRCGYCHQRAFLLLEMLQAGFAGTDATVQMQGLNGHVVLQFVAQGRTFVTDPDYGVGPFEYSSEDSALSQQVSQTYAGSPNLESMLSMYLSREDNQAYSSTNSFNTIKSKQLWWFQFSSLVGVFLLLSGCILVWMGVRR